MSAPSIGILGTGSYLPGEPVPSEAVAPANDPTAKSPLFRPPALRHYIAAGETASEMITRAAQPMFERLGIDPWGNVDLLITNTLLPDLPITGCGADAARRLGCHPELIVDLHNGGCAAFPYMLQLAPAIMAGSGAKHALLCAVQNIATQMFGQPKIRLTSQAAVPGDGCGVAYLVAGEGSPVLGATVRNDPASAADMRVALEDRRYWEAGTDEFNVTFNPDAFQEIITRGNTLVPAVVQELCKALELQPADIDVLITNQPNRQYLRNWRRELGVDPSQHFDTFDRFGNLYGAGAPITLDCAVREGRVNDGDLVVLAGFAHAGDLAAAAAVRWSAPRGASHADR